MSDHTTSDDASRYRDDAEVSEHWPSEPIVRIRKYLIANQYWDKEREEALLRECTQTIEQAATDYLATPRQPVSAGFDYVYAEPPEELIEQRAAALSLTRGAA